MRFYICECSHVWLPSKDEINFECPRCYSIKTKPLPVTTVYQCKLRDTYGVLLLDCDGSKAEIKIPWEEFNQHFVFMDTDLYWAKKIA